MEALEEKIKQCKTENAVRTVINAAVNVAMGLGVVYMASAYGDDNIGYLGAIIAGWNFCDVIKYVNYLRQK